jgi:tetratricopeptide (TPR) repeat protein
MKRWMLLSILPLLLVCIASFWLVSPILKALPSRYVARLPEPIQALGEREHVEVLPTAQAAAADSTALLGDLQTVTQPPPATITPEPTITPVQALTTAGNENDDSKSLPTPLPSATPSATSIPVPPSARIEGIAFQFQDWNNCGPATLAMALSYFGLEVTQQDTARVMKPSPEDRNVSPQEMADYVNEHSEFQAISRANGTLDIIRRLLAHGHPVIVEVGIDPPGDYAWMGWYGHYLLVVAYDDAAEQFWVYDSWFGTSEVPGENATVEGRIISFDELDDRWLQFNRNYVALFRPEEATQVAELIGPDMQDDVMWQAAFERVQQELRANTANAFLWFNLGTIHNALGEYDDAAAAYDQARAIGLPWRMLWYQFGPFEAYYQIGRYEDVILLADVTLQDRPYFEESFYYKGLALAASGQLPAARDNLERAIAFNPGFTAAANALADLD